MQFPAKYFQISKFFCNFAKKTNMESILDFNPTLEEMGRFGIRARHSREQIDLFFTSISDDDKCFQLYILFSSRGDIEKANYYLSKIKSEDLLGILIEDF